jgi:hypothetical protein
MTRDTRIKATARAIRSARLRAALSSLARRRGRFHGNLIRRIITRVGRPAQPSRLQTGLIRPCLPKNMPSVHLKTARLGTGLAGGGGGSPNIAARAA